MFGPKLFVILTELLPFLLGGKGSGGKTIVVLLLLSHNSDIEENNMTKTNEMRRLRQLLIVVLWSFDFLLFVQLQCIYIYLLIGLQIGQDNIDTYISNKVVLDICNR